tara:strand:- start:2032 stop:2304 length:273 start_codon:yes stop_codon:yes gene_type:complete
VLCGCFCIDTLATTNFFISTTGLCIYWGIVPDRIVSDRIISDRIISDRIISDWIISDWIVSDWIVSDWIVSDSVVFSGGIVLGDGFVFCC